jgi:hypothetical protein
VVVGIIVSPPSNTKAVASAESEDRELACEGVDSVAAMLALARLADTTTVERMNCRDEGVDFCSVVVDVIVALALLETEVTEEDSAERIDGLLPTPAIREKRVAARIPRSMILRLTMRRHTKPKSSSAARISMRSRVSAFCMVVMRPFEALIRPEKDVY